MTRLLKFITCGSVDDGKSTLIGHLLYDAKLLFADQKRALELDSKLGSCGGALDYSLLLDGLTAEREQGITIDVAYRYFSTERRSFIVADTPGHEEYTRNMAVGAAFAELAVLLVDASRGLSVQTRRHIRICALMGIRNFVFAINKMDLVDYDKNVYEKIRRELLGLTIGPEEFEIAFIPVSASRGDNIVERSEAMMWYDGPALLEYLETVDTSARREEEGFILNVQRVCRPDHTFRGFQGQVDCGSIEVGDEITVLPSREKARVTALDPTGGLLFAEKGQPVTVCLDREVDISRGCVLARDTEPSVSHMFTSDILWMDDEPLVEGKTYILRLGTQRASATVMAVAHRTDINTGQEIPAKKLYKNELGRCDIVVSWRIVFDAFARHRSLGRWILIDVVTNRTAGCGIVLHPLRRAANLVWQNMDVTRKLRSTRMGQKPLTLWFTGLSGAGKSTLANAVEKELYLRGRYTMLLDGDNIRMGLNQNLGFSEADRIENIRRIAETAKLMNDAGLIVLTAFISPYREERRRAKDIIGAENFIEIYVAAPLEICEERDVKGLYAKARAGEIPNFTGVSSPFEEPQHPTLRIDTSKVTLEEAVESVLHTLASYEERRG